jgi:3-oxoacyl-[acyl-carrier protein] reductase
VSGARELEGKVALVTGGSRNIGRAIVLELAAAGAQIAIITRTDTRAAQAVAKEAQRHGVECRSWIADVTDETAVMRTLAAVARSFGGLDILVNNAAVRTEIEFARMSLQQWHEVLAVTLDGAFLCTRTALPFLTASDAGCIVNIGGLSAYSGAARRAHVVTAKAGLGGFTRALAVELAEHAVTVNLVAPGLIDTARTGAAPHHHATSKTLLGRSGTPQEVAALVRYLAGPRARYVTGQTLHINGGAWLG